MLSSQLEVKIHNVLVSGDFRFEEEKEFADLVVSSGRHLRFDFCIYNEDGSILALIEAQGKQHYTNNTKFKNYSHQKYNDDMKRKYCLQHNYKLISIPYWDESKISFDYIMSLIDL